MIILGVGTAVGKTWVSCELARQLRQRGVTVLALKPVESGFLPEAAAASDGAQLELAAAMPAPVGPHPRYRFKAPLSPHLAAELEDAAVDLDATACWVEANERALQAPIRGALRGKSRNVLLVETAGGAFSPLSFEHTNADLVGRLLPARVVLVAPDRLGVLHDVSACVQALRARGLLVDDVIVNGSAAVDQSTGTNAKELERLRKVVGLSMSSRIWQVAGGTPADLEPLVALLEKGATPANRS